MNEAVKISNAMLKEVLTDALVLRPQGTGLRHVYDAGVLWKSEPPDCGGTIRRARTDTECCWYSASPRSSPRFTFRTQTQAVVV